MPLMCLNGEPFTMPEETIPWAQVPAGSLVSWFPEYSDYYLWTKRQDGGITQLTGRDAYPESRCTSHHSRLPTYVLLSGPLTLSGKPCL